jgi:hypothetical protein
VRGRLVRKRSNGIEFPLQIPIAAKLLKKRIMISIKNDHTMEFADDNRKPGMFPCDSKSIPENVKDSGD